MVGAVLLGASLLGGGDHDADGDADSDHDAGGGDADAGGDGDGDHHHDPSHGDLGGVLFLFLSLRFWTFFAAAFGLTGILTHLLELASPVTGLIGALAVGLVSGFGAAAVFRMLSRQEVGSVAGYADYIGQSARVLLPFGKGQTGKVRLQLRGTTVDVLASTDEQAPFAANEQALVVEMQGTTAFVMRMAPSQEPKQITEQNTNEEP